MRFGMGRLKIPLTLWVFFLPTWHWIGRWIVEDEDPSLAILYAFEKDFLWEVKVVRPKSKGRREILNLVSSINYGDTSASTRHRKSKAHVW
jgi:hypothetical protein